MVALMRARRSQGRPGTQVIPANWGESHAPVAAKTMTQPVNLRHPGTSSVTFDEVLGHSVVTPLPAYCITKARIQAHRETAQPMPQEQAEESVRISGYLVTLPLDAGLTELAVGDLIDVPTSCVDPLLAGVSLRIVELIRSSLRFERDVFAIINDTAQTGTAT